MKKNGLKKKSLTLAAAVVSALEVGSVAGNMWMPTVNVAEAATALSEEERIAKGYPKIAGITYYDNGTVGGSFGYRINTASIESYDEDSLVVRYSGGGYYAKTTSGVVCMASKYTPTQGGAIGPGYTYGIVGDAGACSSAFKSLKGHIVVSQGSTHYPDSDSSHSSFNTTYYSLISTPGVGASETDTKKHLEKNGIETTSTDIKITKDMSTKDINADGKITTTGGVEAGGDIHGKGNETIDGKIHGKGDIEVDGEATLHGNTVVEGKTINKGEVVNETTVTNKGDVINEANVTTKGTTTHEGEVINKSLVTNESDVHTKGNEIIDGNATIHGDTTIDGTTTLKGDTTIGDGADDKVVVNGTAEFKENTQFDKDVTVKGSQTVEQNLHVKGDSVTEGNSTVEGDATIKGSTTLGDDKNADVLEVNAKTNIHGDTTIGDSSDDKFTVNATSEFKSDTTFDRNVLVKGDQTVDGDSHTKGNAEVDKDLAVHGSEVIDGDSVVHGDSTVDGKFHAKNDAEFDQNVTIHGSETVDGDSHIKGNIEVDKDMTVHGAMVVDGGMRVSDDFSTKGNMTVDKTLTVGGDAHISGDTILDGKFFAKGAATFGDSVDIAKNLTVGGNTHVIGDSVVDGDSYARSFNIGNEKYIDSNGINANGHKIRNVADGEISPNSLDAVNGRQLYHTREALQHNIDQVGAATAAMASLHPLDYEHDDKLSVSAAMGNYKDKTAMAVGVFYRPNIKSMVNLSGTLGYGDNMFGIGVSTKMGKVTEEDNMTDEQLRDKVSEIHDENKELREENGKLKSEVSDLKQEILKSHEQATAQENQIAALMSKVDGLVSELATLKAAQK